MTPLATGVDYVYLSRWNFFPNYGKYKDRLVQVANAVYQGLAASGQLPQLIDCERELTFALIAAKAFSDLALANNIVKDPLLYTSFASASVSAALLAYSRRLFAKG
jgi:hypothetical protein